MAKPRLFCIPTDAEWGKVLRKARRLFPLAFPVEVTRSSTPPKWAEKDWAAGAYVVYGYRSHKISNAVIWVDGRQQLAASVDCLLHEWTHLLCEEEAPNNGGLVLHDNRFWLKQGEVYRAWYRTS
jgi:hypothetical protein